LPKEFRLKEVELPEMSAAEVDAMLDMLRTLIAEKEQRGEGGALAQEPSLHPASDATQYWHLGS
jgi:hypothetical protein